MKVSQSQSPSAPLRLCDIAAYWDVVARRSGAAGLRGCGRHGRVTSGLWGIVAVGLRASGRWRHGAVGLRASRPCDIGAVGLWDCGTAGLRGRGDVGHRGCGIMGSRCTETGRGRPGATSEACGRMVVGVSARTHPGGVHGAVGLRDVGTLGLWDYGTPPSARSRICLRGAVQKGAPRQGVVARGSGG